MKKARWLLPVAAALLLLVLAANAQDKPKTQKTYSNVTLVTDKPWKVGEARWCSFDGKYVEMHCFPPDKLGVPKTNYLVDVDFDKPPKFDKDNWAGNERPTVLSKTLAGSISCRLDSFKHASCVDRGE
jgi:hypothetical protein